MSYQNLIGLLSVLGLLTACVGAESDAKKAVLAVLKDPDSAKFGKFTNIKDQAACLTVNARNSMGGYTGDQQALLVKLDGQWTAIDVKDVTHDRCLIMVVNR